MRDGSLWDAPMFGLFSPLLNSVAPGLGNNRATASKGRFTIDKSVIRTGDLVINAPPLRLQYRGTVDFETRVNAHVEAEILRATPILGPLISLALTPVSKVLIYKVTGTLGEPLSEPLYVPKILNSLVHPFRTLRQLLPLELEPPKPVK